MHSPIPFSHVVQQLWTRFVNGAVDGGSNVRRHNACAHVFSRGPVSHRSHSCIVTNTMRRACWLLVLLAVLPALCAALEGKCSACKFVAVSSWRLCSRIPMCLSRLAALHSFSRP